MKNIFTKHPHQIGETYTQHFIFAFVFGIKTLAASCACFVHAIFPFLFEKTGSNILLRVVHNLIERMPANEDRIMQLSNLIQKKRNDGY